MQTNNYEIKDSSLPETPRLLRIYRKEMSEGSQIVTRKNGVNVYSS